MKVCKINSFEEFDKNKDIIIYGAGKTGKGIFEILRENNHRVRYFIDDDINKRGNKLNEINIISLLEFEKLYKGKKFILILGSIYINALVKHLEDREFFKNNDNAVYDMHGIYSNEKINQVKKFIKIKNYNYVRENFSYLYYIFQDEESRKILEVMKKVYSEEYLGFDIYEDICSTQDQYFTTEVLKKINGKSINVIDGGAFHGEILSDLLSHEISIGRIFLFEANKENYKILKENTNAAGFLCIPINKGLWNVKGQVYLDGMGDQCKIVNYKTNQSIEVTTIDDVAGDSQIDFIKMDIEGAEMYALRGGEATLKRCRPILAISIYHSPEDFVQIPIYLNNLLCGYTWRLLHHTNEYYETILYGIPD